MNGKEAIKQMRRLPGVARLGTRLGLVVALILLLASLSAGSALAQVAEPKLGGIEKAVEQIGKKIDPPAPRPNQTTSDGQSISSGNSGRTSVQPSSQGSGSGDLGQLEKSVSDTVEKQIQPQVESTANQLAGAGEDRANQAWNLVDKQIQPTVEAFGEKTPTPVPPTATPVTPTEPTVPPTETPVPPTATSTATSNETSSNEEGESGSSSGGQQSGGGGSESSPAPEVAAAAPAGAPGSAPEAQGGQPAPTSAPMAQPAATPAPTVAAAVPRVPPVVAVLPVTGGYDPAFLALSLTLLAGSGLALRWLSHWRS